MAFDFEWTGRAYGDESDRQRGIRQAESYCRDHGYDAEAIWNAIEKDDDEARGQWGDIESAAIDALCHGWQEIPENVSLIWRS